jgi:uncharacterized protein (TIGR02145 family)
MTKKQHLGLFLIFALTINACNSPTSNAPTFDLALSANPSEGGIVNAVSGTYDENTPVLIQAIPSEGWRFAGWNGDITGTDSPQTIRMTRNYSITASFEKRNYELTINTQGEGSVLEEVVTGREYPFQTTVRLSAQPTQGWQFDSWSGDLTGSENPQNLTINEAKTVTATFVQNTASFTLGEPDYLDETQARLSGSIMLPQGAFGAIVGLCYGSSTETSDSDVCKTIDTSSSATATFTFNLTRLDDNTRYFVRGYTEIEGNRTFSDNLIEFSTPEANYQKGNGAVDADGNEYKTVIIGQQEWMAENLRTRTYADGSPVLASHIRSRGGNLIQNTFFYGDAFGELYSRNVIEYSESTVCPAGFHVPSLAEWNYMLDEVGRDQAGSRLRAKGPIFWESSNSASNETGFSAIAAGHSEASNLSSSFKNLLLRANYYTSTAGGRDFNWSVQLRVDSDEVTTESITEYLAIRCVKDGFDVPTEPLAVVQMPIITEITPTRATVNVTYEQPGANAITERGFCMDVEGDPTIFDVCFKDTNYGPGSFSFEVSGLSAESTYRVRGYAFTEDGLSYGPTTSFTTAE